MKAKNQNENPSEIDLEKKTLKKGLSSGWTRTTVVMREELLERLKDLAYWERTGIKHIIDEVVEKFFSTREVKPRPKEKKKILE